jgi:hypothetical protein
MGAPGQGSMPILAAMESTLRKNDCVVQKLY